MNFVERYIARKEVDMVLEFIKKHWPLVLHALALGLIFLDPSVQVFFKDHPEYAPVGMVLWAEGMRWLKSPRNIN